ncbi:MAG: hypothetical protein JXR37_04250 [Kiritimatiellae bacterium]|nr:hypothetical protein [Kiritimatiellia bacterium]
MRRLGLAVGIVLVAIFLPGCFIQSLQPFFTEDSKTDLPDIAGKWRLVKQGERDVSEKYKEAWTFGQDTIQTFEEGVASLLKVQYFKVAEVVFADLSRGDPDKLKAPNPWWMIHTVPAHSVCKVDLTGDALVMTPLNGEWVADLFKEKKLSLPHTTVGEDADQIVLTASSAELTEFLGTCVSNTAAFPSDFSYRFTRVKQE